MRCSSIKIEVGKADDGRGVVNLLVGNNKLESVGKHFAINQVARVEMSPGMARSTAADLVEVAAEIDKAKPPIEDEQVVEIEYTNWRGERREREIMPISIRFGSNEWHPDEQWLLLARDIERNEDREFALDAIHSWSR